MFMGIKGKTKEPFYFFVGGQKSGGFQLVKGFTTAFVLDFGVEFVDVVTKTKQEQLGGYVWIAAGQKTVKLPVLFQYAEGALGLD